MQGSEYIKTALAIDTGVCAAIFSLSITATTKECELFIEAMSERFIGHGFEKEEVNKFLEEFSIGIETFRKVRENAR